MPGILPKQLFPSEPQIDAEEQNGISADYADYADYVLRLEKVCRLEASSIETRFSVLGIVITRFLRSKT
jgi:hypothetical protein